MFSALRGRCEREQAIEQRVPNTDYTDTSSKKLPPYTQLNLIPVDADSSFSEYLLLATSPGIRYLLSWRDVCQGRHLWIGPVPDPLRRVRGFTIPLRPIPDDLRRIGVDRVGGVREIQVDAPDPLDVRIPRQSRVLEAALRRLLDPIATPGLHEEIGVILAGHFAKGLTEVVEESVEDTFRPRWQRPPENIHSRYNGKTMLHSRTRRSTQGNLEQKYRPS